MRFLMMCSLLASSVVVGACGGNADDGAAANGDVAAPEIVQEAGALEVCADINFPPAEFLEGGQPQGYDIDIANHIADQWGVEPDFSNVGFDGLIAGLKSGRCDAIISTLYNTPERAQEVDFVDYFKIGQSLLVAAGNPDGVSDLASLSGMAVAVQTGTVQADSLEANNKKLEAAGEEPAEAVFFPRSTDAASALKTGKVDAFFDGSGTIAYQLQLDPETFEVAGVPIDPLPVGIALRKDEDELKDSLTGIVDTMWADGTMEDIFAAWELDDLVFPPEGVDAGGGSAANGTVKTPARVADAGELVYCTEGTYPPLSYQEGAEVVGSDIDIGRELAERLGVEAAYTPMSFDALIPSLQSEKCDAILSGLSVTPERAAQVAFTNYSLAPQGLMLPKGNPAGIETVDDLSGKSASVLAGTNNLEALRQLDEEFTAAGKAGIDITVFQKESDAANALQTGKSDAYAGGLASITYYVNREGSGLEKGPTFEEEYIPRTTYGIGTRKDDHELRDALAPAVRAIYDDGTIEEILGQYDLTEFLLTGPTASCIGAEEC